MISKLKSTIALPLTNMRGWRTNRRIVVFESDDWGSIRMPNKSVYETLSKSSQFIKNNPYCKFDSLESKEDLEALFEVLFKFRDSKGRCPVITANTVVANPDFKKIKDSNFIQYFYEPFPLTLKRYYPNDDVWQLWKYGLDEKLFYAQFHGREHLNVNYWLQLLREKNIEVCKSFDYNCWISTPRKRNIQASYDYTTLQEEEFACKIVESGLDLFKEIFHYHSFSFIANNFIWSEAIESTLNSRDIKIIQGMKYQKLPLLYSPKKRRMKRHYLGSQNIHGQTYLIRNCVFEPSQTASGNEVNTCMAEISSAFLWKKPAIITTHRLNFIGSIIEKNRTENLNMLYELLKRITTKWPDVEFMSSKELGELIRK